MPTGAAVATLPRFHPHRLNLNKSRLLSRAAKGFLSKPLTKAPESTPGSQSFDYVPLVSAPDPRPQPPTLSEGPSREPPAHPSPFTKGRRSRPSCPRSQQGKGPGPRVLLEACASITNILCNLLSLL